MMKHTTIPLSLLILISIATTLPIQSSDFSLHAAYIGGDQTITDVGLQTQQTNQPKFQSPPIFKSFGREYAREESEPWLSKLDSQYTNAHNFIADIVGHKPIVDTLSERDKYGNDGATSRKVAAGVIGGFETFSNIANSLIDAPVQKANTLSKTATAALNSIGASLVGL